MSPDRIKLLGEVHGCWTALVRPIGHHEAPVAFYIVRRGPGKLPLLRSSAGLRLECPNEEAARALVYKVANWQGLELPTGATSAPSGLPKRS